MQREQLDNSYAVAGAVAYRFVAPPTNMMLGPQHYGDPNNWEVIAGADGHSMQALGKGYARDKDRAYFAGTPLPQSNSSTFAVLNGPFARDAARVYFGTTIVTDADPASFRADGKHGSRYGWDHQRVYYADWQTVTVLPVAPETFEVLDATHARDATRVLFGAAVSAADPKSFVLLSDYYSKDQRTVFFGDEPSRADPASFEVVSFTPVGKRTASFGRDAKHVYYLSTQIPGADPGSFVDLTGHYAKDEKSVYYRSEALPDADLASFEPLTPSIFFPGKGNAVAQDVTHYYAETATGPHTWKR